MRAASLALAAGLLALPTAVQAQKGGAPTAAPPTQPVQPPGPPGRSPDAAAVAALPPQIAGFARQEGITDYEARPNSRGLGASINYEVANGSPYATVYLYNRNRPAELSGPATGPAADAELVVARREIENASERRGYRIGSVRRLPDIAGADGAPAFRCDAYTFEYGEEQTIADSYACVGIARNRYVKVRVSFRPRASTVAVRELPADFMRGVAEATGFGQGSGQGIGQGTGQGRGATGGKS